MLLVFINPSGPTRELQELVLLNNIVSFRIQHRIRQRMPWGDLLVGIVQVGHRWKPDTGRTS